MFHRSFRFILGAALLTALPALASASTSRLEGMGLPGDYTKDYTAIYSWPSSITSVGNLIYAELGNNQVNQFTGVPNNYERGMGAVLNNLFDGHFGTWGIHLREQTPSLGQGDVMNGPNPGAGGNDPNDNQNEAFDIMWGRKMGGTSLGLRVNRSYAKGTDELAGVTTEFQYDPLGVANLGNPNLARNIFGLGGGLGFEVSDKTSAEVSILWQNRSFDAISSPTVKVEDNGGTTYQMAGRMMWKWEPNVVVVPVAKFYSFDLSQKNTNGATSNSYDNSLKGWQVGIAGNWALGSNDLFVLGVNAAQNKLDQQADIFNLNGGPLSGFGFSDTLKVTETFFPQVFMALESQVNHWLTLRFGAKKGVFHSYKVEGNSAGGQQKVEYKDSPFSMNIGAGVKVGSLQFDTVLDNLFYLNPFAQLQGNQKSAYWQGGGQAFEKVSVTYAW